MMLAFNGALLDHKDWARLLGITEQTLRWRIDHWGVEKALSTAKRAPKQRQRQRRRHGKFSPTEKETIARLYVSGYSEDKIAGALHASRKTISRFLAGTGLKKKGNAAKRAYKGKTVDIQQNCAGIIVTLGKAA